MCLTAILQIFMPVMIYRLSTKGTMLDILAMVSGILAGVFQVLGFFRWVILMPMLSNALQAKEVPGETVFFFEKFSNTFFGITIGEHLGTFFLALWLIFLGIRLLRQNEVEKGLSVLATISGLALLLSSYENLSIRFAFLGKLTATLWGFYLVWVLLTSVSMFIQKENAPPIKIHKAWWVFGAIFYLANVIPSLL
jgi:hypothetical protein